MIPGIELVLNKELRKKLELYDEASSIFED
jgi:hypothetical protein